MTHDEFDVGESDQGGFDRRAFIRRAAVVGAATVWTAPTVQSIASPAFALGSPLVNDCGGCLTGGGRYQPATYAGAAITKVTFGLTRLCCGDPHCAIEVNAHGTVDGTVNWNFKDNFVMSCFKEGITPEPPPATEECANKFVGSADALDHPSGPAHLEFTFIDHGEPNNLDVAKITVTDIASGNVLIAEGILDNGNLQAHESLGPMKQDCSGC